MNAHDDVRGANMNDQIICARCGGVNSAAARYCQQCGMSLLGPVGAKGMPQAANQSPQAPSTTTTTAPQQTPVPGQGQPNWSQTALGGVVGFLLGSMFGGGRGFFRGGDFDGGDFGGGDFGGGDGGG
jgi:ribosomal protein L40E